MKNTTIALLLVAACGTNEGKQHPELRAAVDRAQYSLGEYVELAQANVLYSTGIDARIHRDVEQFFVHADATGVRHDVRLDFAGLVVSSQAAGNAGAGCETQISLPEALAIAEADAGGNAVAVVPDDDDACMREIQVLVDMTLWEVKVGPTGAIVEKELSDEDL